MTCLWRKISTAKLQKGGSYFPYMFSKHIIAACVNITHQWDVHKTSTIGNEVPLQPHQGEHTQVNTNTHRHANPGGVDVDDSEKQGYSFFFFFLK